MKKALIVTIVVLLAALVAETAYLIKMTSDLQRDRAGSQYGEDRSPYRGPVPSQAPVRPSSQRRYSVPVDPDPFGSAYHDWDPFAEMEEIRGLMNRMFRDSFSRGIADRGLTAGIGAYDPDVDLQDTGKEYVFHFDLPGLDKDKISVSVQNGQLTVSGERRTEKEENAAEDGYYRMERSFGSFARSFPLPADADTERMTAQTKDGVLTVRIPKSAEAAAAAKRVPVS